MSEQPKDPTQQELDSWVAAAKDGQLSWSELAERLLRLEHDRAAEDRPDRDRKRRCGFGEVIYGSGKSAATITSITYDLLDSGQSEVLVTRVDQDCHQQLLQEFGHVRFCADAGTLRISKVPIQAVRPLPFPEAESSSASTKRSSNQIGKVSVLTAGSTDIAVGREAVETLGWMGVATDFFRDVGVAGPYRLLPHLEHLRSSAAVVVVAGMEGALVSVVGGLVPCPVIAVPTSVGYGANLEGITTLLSMISSCAAGVTVVNIDAGFKGGYVAGLIAHQAAARSALQS